MSIRRPLSRLACRMGTRGLRIDYHLSPLLFLYLLGSRADKHLTGIISTSQPAIPLLTASLCADLPVVKAASFDAYLALWPRYDHRTIPAFSTRRPRLAVEWYVEGSCW